MSVEDIRREILKLGDLFVSHFHATDNYTKTAELMLQFYNDHYDAGGIMASGSSM